MWCDNHLETALSDKISWIFQEEAAVPKMCMLFSVKKASLFSLFFFLFFFFFYFLYNSEC